MEQKKFYSQESTRQYLAAQLLERGNELTTRSRTQLTLSLEEKFQLNVMALKMLTRASEIILSLYTQAPTLNEDQPE
jgi:hypothetical protein